ncbi:MAG: alpha/beta hydrolase [Halanaerobiales bacterium]|nr:alpha/beta hydrolase [Halanaerobiales bacterium]
MNKKRVFLIISIVLLIIISGTYFYLSQSYKPVAANQNFINKEKILESDIYYFFKAENNYDTAFIFYQGGRVEELSYAPICEKLRKKGYSVFLVKMPFNLAVFDLDRAKMILDEYKDDIRNWYLIGHSLGGSMAASYLNDVNDKKLKGLILLASYPAESVDLSNKDFEVLSITASQDEILDQKKYNTTKDNLPFNTVYKQIEGGNHAGFGNYGVQSGDGKIKIKKEEQWDYTVNLIIDFINQN